MTFKINGREIGLNNPPYVVAEMSANHNGSLERALKTINAAKACGADAIKMQTYVADSMTINCDLPDFIVKGGLWDGYKLYDLYKWAETPYEWHQEIFEHAKKVGITIFSTPFDEAAVDLLESLHSPAYKIASFEIVDLALIRYVANTGKPLIISTGMATELEIEEAVTAAREAGCKNLILLHCISSYPTPIDQSNLLKISTLAKRYKLLSGLSDHTLGTVASVVGVSLGACFIEKHFTISRQDKGPDSEFSLEPEEFKRLCRDAKNAWLSLGNGGFEREIVETDSKVFRRSLYFNKDLPAGHIIGVDDIRCIRPGMGLAPKYIDAVFGKKLKTTVSRGAPVSLEILFDV